MPKALQHTYPTFEFPPGIEVGNDEPREVWHGAMRVVSARRARKLRKRGVPLMPLHAVYLNPCDAERGQSRAPLTPGNGPGKRSARYAWFECKDDAEGRRRDKARACYNTWCEANGGRVGRRYELAELLHEQREWHAAERYFRQGGKLAATTYFQTFERYAGVPYENVLNPQLDLYAAAFRSMRETEQVATEWGDVPMPAHWTDEQKRHYIQHGYVVEVGHGETDGRVHRRSPPVTLWCAPYESTGPLEFGSEPANAGVPTHYEPNDYTRALLRNATPEQLEAAKAVDMSDFHEGLKRAKLAAWERTRYAKPLLDPSYAGAPHLDCDCMACRPYTG